MRDLAAQAVAGASSRLPFHQRIAESFGAYDLTDVRAATDDRAAAATGELGAHGLATGNRVALGRGADLHTVAHEAAHVVQQRAGVHLSSGVGQAGDRYEQHADAVADLVVQGRSAESTLAQVAGPPSAQGAGGGPVQLVRMTSAELVKAGLKQKEGMFNPHLLKMHAALLKYHLSKKPSKKAANAATIVKVCDDWLLCDNNVESLKPVLYPKIVELKQEAQLEAVWHAYDPEIQTTEVDPDLQPYIVKSPNTLSKIDEKKIDEKVEDNIDENIDENTGKELDNQKVDKDDTKQDDENILDITDEEEGKDIKEIEEKVDDRKTILPTMETTKAPLWGDKGPQLEDVKQGQLGDCYLLGAVGALVKKDPDIIWSMFQDHGETVTVRLFDVNGPKLIKVKKTVPRVKTGNGDEVVDPYARGALWVQMLEKATASVVGSYGDLGGGTGQEAMRMLTGHGDDISMELSESQAAEARDAMPWPEKLPGTSGKVDFSVKKEIEFKRGLYKKILGKDAGTWEGLVESQEGRVGIVDAVTLRGFKDELENRKLEASIVSKMCTYMAEQRLLPGDLGGGQYSRVEEAVFERLQAALDGNKAVAAGTKGLLRGQVGGYGDSGGESKVDGLASSHNYTVLGVSEDEKGRKWVKVRNPWGQYSRAYDEDDEGLLKARAVEGGDGVSTIDLSDFTDSFDKLTGC